MRRVLTPSGDQTPDGERIAASSSKKNPPVRKTDAAEKKRKIFLYATHLLYHILYCTVLGLIVLLEKLFSVLRVLFPFSFYLFFFYIFIFSFHKTWMGYELWAPLDNL